MSNTYVGIHTQIQRNQFKTVLLLIAFPILLLTLVWVFFYFFSPAPVGDKHLPSIHQQFLGAIPWVMLFTIIWFTIAWFSHTSIINKVTGAKPLERKDNKRVYNLLENLCIAEGMNIPKLQIIESDALNAFASGINKKSYRITLTRGIVDTLNDEELEGVIAHELAHIKNRDVRLLIVSIIFVGIFSFIAQIAFRSMFYRSFTRGRDRGGGGRAMLLILVLAIVAYFFSMIFRFAISRKREYMADAESARMTKRPDALASALKKISGNYKIGSVKSDDVAEMFIENKPNDDESKGLLSSLSGLFASHPPIEERIRVLEQY